MIYKEEDVKRESLKYFNGDELAASVWIDKYCLKDGDKLLELSPSDMHKRIAKEFARIEKKYSNPIEYEEIFKLLENQVILPGGSLLYGIGNNYSISSLGNCFVIGNDADSIGGIFTVAQEQAQLMKRRAGVGHDVSHLRAKGESVTNSAKSSTGIETWEDFYSFVTRKIAQDGRRGALMMSCNINSPNAEEFITSKCDLTKITGANISVKVDDEFMQIVEDEQYLDLKQSLTNSFYLWDKLVHQAWKSAEPGILFWDKIKSESIPSCYGKEWEEKSTNPCGEIPLCPYDSCRLLSINLTKFVDNPFTSKASFNWKKFKQIVYIAQKLMDDVVDLEEEKINRILKKIDNDPEAEEIKAVEKNLWLKIKNKLLQGRRTGLSGIGLADTLASLNMPYANNNINDNSSNNSNDNNLSSFELAEEIYKQLAITAYKSSIDMAKDRGAFPIWKWSKEVNNPFLSRILGELSQTKEGYEIYALNLVKYGRRNIALLTIPPSGTISLLAGISSGIEPVYQLSYKRRRKVDPNHPNISFIDKNGDCWEEYEVLHPKYAEYIAISGDMYNTESPYHGSTAYELNPLDRIKMQATIQNFVDHSISSTINLPKEATEKDVANIYMEAWKQGCKGITIYRDGSRDGVLINTNKKDDSVDFIQHNAPKRPKYLPCDIFTPTTHGQQYVVVVGKLDGQPYEVFAFKFDGKFNLKEGYLAKIKRGRYDILTLDKEIYSEDITSDMSQIEEDRTRLISWGLRHGAGLKFLVEQLSKAKGNGFQDFSKVIARTLKRYIKDEEKVTGTACDNCGSSDLIYKDGCQECQSCGSSRCN